MTADIPEQLATYFQQRANARVSAVNEVLDGLTDRERGLIHDAAVMGYVRGSLHPKGEDIPSDAGIVADVVNACLHHADLYPTLTGYVPEPLCAACGHAEDEHEEGDDPVTPGTCAACEDDEDRHGFQTAGEAQPQRGELWSLLDWTFWGSGMGDVFREPLADTMLASITTDQLETAEQLMAAWHASGRQPLGRRHYENLSAQLKAVQEQLAEHENIRAAVTEGKSIGRALTASDVQVAHDITRKALADALDAGLHLNWTQLVTEAQRSHAANAAWKADVDRVRELHVRNRHTGSCEHCSAGDYPDYDVPWPCPTIDALENREPRQATRPEAR